MFKRPSAWVRNTRVFVLFLPHTSTANLGELLILYKPQLLDTYLSVYIAA